MTDYGQTRPAHRVIPHSRQWLTVRALTHEALPGRPEPVRESGAVRGRRLPKIKASEKAAQASGAERTGGGLRPPEECLQKGPRAGRWCDRPVRNATRARPPDLWSGALIKAAGPAVSFVPLSLPQQSSNHLGCYGVSIYQQICRNFYLLLIGENIHCAKTSLCQTS